nr:AAA family ATPase [Butyricimonas synergistica]
MIKVLTSIRRCGKSFLLFQLYSSWLKEQGISDDHIIKIDLEDRLKIR